MNNGKIMFETFEEKIKRDLSKDEVKDLFRTHCEEIINYTKNMKNISGFDKEIINNLCNYYNSQIDKYQDRIQKLKENFGSKYPEIFI